MAAFPPLTLSFDRAEIADHSRAALESFFTDVAQGGGALEMRDWLLGPYSRAVLSGERPEGPPSSGRVNRVTLNERIQEARGRVVGRLRSLKAPEMGMHFTMIAACEGWVVPFVDRRGKAGYIPLDLPRMTLVQRLESLVAADCLARPESYVHELIVCDACEGIEFREHGPDEEELCRLCSRASGIHFRPTVVPLADVG